MTQPSARTLIDPTRAVPERSSPEPQRERTVSERGSPDPQRQRVVRERGSSDPQQDEAGASVYLRLTRLRSLAPAAVGGVALRDGKRFARRGKARPKVACLGPNSLPSGGTLTQPPAALRWLLLAGWLLGVLLCGHDGYAETNAGPTVVVVVGAPGEEEYGRQFAAWAEQWRNLAQRAGAEHFAIGLGPTNAVTDREQLDRVLTELPRESEQELWLVLLGHGTFDGQDAKFNLRGPDLTAPELAGWLGPFRRPVAVINCASSSGPFLPALSRTNRVIVTATQSGYEQNYARFGQYLIEALADTPADLDKDGQVSLLEAFLVGSRRVGEFYETDSRLATEHALLDDNGDGKGTPADWFHGVRVVRKAEDAVADGLRAHQIHLVRSARELAMPPALRAQRDQLELAIEQLRARKRDLSEADYYRRLEALLLDLGRIYQASGQLDVLPQPSAPNP